MKNTDPSVREKNVELVVGVANRITHVKLPTGELVEVTYELLARVQDPNHVGETVVSRNKTQGITELTYRCLRALVKQGAQTYNVDENGEATFVPLPDINKWKVNIAGNPMTQHLCNLRTPVNSNASSSENSEGENPVKSEPMDQTITRADETTLGFALGVAYNKVMADPNLGPAETQTLVFDLVNQAVKDANTTPECFDVEDYNDKVFTLAYPYFNHIRDNDVAKSDRFVEKLNEFMNELREEFGVKTREVPIADPENPMSITAVVESNDVANMVFKFSNKLMARNVNLADFPAVEEAVKLMAENQKVEPVAVSTTDETPVESTQVFNRYRTTA